jgi:uncharacterized membrane protein
MLIWKALHVLSMFTMVAVFIGAEIFYAAAMWRRDAHMLAWIQRTVERAFLGWVGLGGILLGIVFGLLTAAAGGFDFVAGWLVAAYVLVVLFFVNSALYGARVVHVGQAAMKAEDEGQPLEEIASSLNRADGLIVVAVNATIFALIILDMVLKPF